MPRTAVTRRLRYLRNGEFFNVIFLPGALALVLSTTKVPTYLLYTYAMGIICFILAQGGLYWHLKLRIVTGRADALPEAFRPRYANLRRANVVLLALYPFLAVAAALTDTTRGWEPLWATLLAVFAALEHINYYHYQLMYDNGRDLQWLARHKRLRRAHLAEDLQATNHTHPHE